MRKILLILTVITTLVSCGVKIPKSMSKEEFKSLEDGLYAKMTTNHGAMTIKLYEEEAPMKVQKKIKQKQKEFLFMMESFFTV